MRTSASLALALLATSLPYASATFNLLQNWQGSSFFSSGWDFYGNYDNLTNGDVIFVNQSLATSAQLAYLNSAGNAIIKVDNTTNVLYNDKRNTVRLSSTQAYGLGSLWVMDALHIPFGCSVWPAFWSQATSWPQGEIDTLENVNLATTNQMALHTLDGCSASTTAAMTGKLQNADCGTNTTLGETTGCTVDDSNTASYGQPFANAGGGAWATLMVEGGVFIWFWNRANIPSDLTPSNANSSPNPDNWGTPSASYPASSCNTTEFFEPQHIILDITLCGDFAGALAIYGLTCGPVPADAASNYCYTQNVIGNGTNYANAYFEVQYVRVWSNTTTAATTNTTSGGNSSSGGSGSGSKSGAPVGMPTVKAAWAGLLFAVAGVLALL